MRVCLKYEFILTDVENEYVYSINPRGRSRVHTIRPMNFDDINFFFYYEPIFLCQTPKKEEEEEEKGYEFVSPKWRVYTIHIHTERTHCIQIHLLYFSMCLRNVHFSLLLLVQMLKRMHRIYKFGAICYGK